MKTKTIGAMNGNGAGPEKGTRAQLHRLYAFHSGRAEALRITLELLDDAALQRRGLRSDSVIVEAVRLDEQRRQATAKPAKKRTIRRSGKYTAAAIRQRRQVSARRLAKVSKDDNKPTKQITSELMPLLRHAYIKHVPGGYIRTAKEFRP